MPRDTSSGWRQIPATDPVAARVPVSLLLHFRPRGSGRSFFWSACFGVIPLASLMATATEHLAERTGPTVGGLLNAGSAMRPNSLSRSAALNAAGYFELVQASITGSILSNLLLILGLALLTGGMRQRRVALRSDRGRHERCYARDCGRGLSSSRRSSRPTPQHGHDLRLSISVVTISWPLPILVPNFYVLGTHKSPLFDPRGHRGLTGRSGPCLLGRRACTGNGRGVAV